MNLKTFVLAGGAGSLIAAGVASAGFLNLTLEEYVGPGWNDNGYDVAGLTTYRLYANFDGLGDDGVLAAFGQPGDPVSVESSDGLFHNQVGMFSGNTAPSDVTSLGIWNNLWDTYVTIGTDLATGDETSTSPGFGSNTGDLGANWSNDNAGWFVTPIDAQSEGTNLLLAQFVVAQGETVRGTVNLLTRENRTIKDLAFPAPGALALLGLAGVAGSRRRRK